ncbi:hypothetical protein GQR58_014144 [Nymphon striatum]|nr:hypothetical protein GQR58_014144 [Nymphon striatum]
MFYFTTADNLTLVIFLVCICGLAASQNRRIYHPDTIILGEYNPHTPYGRNVHPDPRRHHPRPIHSVAPHQRSHGPRQPIRYGRKYQPVLSNTHYNIGIKEYGYADVNVDQGRQGFRYSVEQKHPGGGHSSVYSSASVHH